VYSSNFTKLLDVKGDATDGGGSVSEFETDEEIENMLMRNNAEIEVRETCFDLLYPDYDEILEKRNLKKAEKAKKVRTEFNYRKSRRKRSKTAEEMKAQLMGSEMAKLDMLVKNREKRERSPVYDPFGIKELYDVQPFDDVNDELFEGDEEKIVKAKVEPSTWEYEPTAVGLTFREEHGEGVDSKEFTSAKSLSEYDNDSNGNDCNMTSALPELEKDHD